MKKALLAAIIATFAIAIAAPTHAYYYPKQGDLVKTSYSSAVYYVDGSNTRHLFPTGATFFTWYTGNWSNQSIITLTDSEFNQLSSGKNVTARAGSAVLRFDNSLVMYAVLPGGKLCHASYNYNNYQYNRAIIIPASFQSDYYNDGVCDISYNSNLPDGSLIRYQNSSDIYYIQNGYRRKVTSYGFSSNNFRYESVITDVSWSMSYPEGSVIDGPDSTISSIAYYLNNYSYNNYFNNYANYNSYYNYNYNYSCSENWICGTYSTCSNGSQYRYCYDANNCNTSYNKPATTQSCYSYNYVCQPNWTCGAWTSCAYGNQYRSCNDTNNCNSTYNKPATVQSCTVCNENWTCGSWGSCQGTGSTGWQYRTCYDSNNCGTTKSKPITSQSCNRCSENWSCTSWTKCSGGSQTRSCVDVNACGSTYSKPSTYQYCY